MELVILGSGTFQPEINRHCASHLLKIGKENIIFDFGRGAIDAILKQNINLFDIKQVFITHFDADHFSEISSLLHWIYSAPGLNKIYKFPILTVYGPKGLKERLENLMNAFVKSIDKKKDEKAERIKVIELKEGETVGGKNWQVTGYKVEHSNRFISIAYRFKSKNKVLCYSGDCGDCEGIRKACLNADIALIEATLPSKWNIKSHLTGEQVGKIATDLNIKKVIATHVAPHYLKDVKKDIKKRYGGEIFIAKDLMKIKF